MYTPAFFSWPTWVHLCFGGKSRLIVYQGTAFLYEQHVKNVKKKKTLHESCLFIGLFTLKDTYKEINPTHTHAGNHMNMIKKC